MSREPTMGGMDPQAQATSRSRLWGLLGRLLDEVLARTEELAPRLPVEHAAWGSPRAIRWIDQEEPDLTQFGELD